MHLRAPAIVTSALLITCLCGSVRAERSVGVAAVDITPDYNVRLNGFGNRRTESEGVTAKIWAKAIAIDDGGENGTGKTVLITADNLGVPAYMTQEVAKRL